MPPKMAKPELMSEHSISFCCTLLTNRFLATYNFNQLDPSLDWFDVPITRQSRALGFKNYISKDFPVLHQPHGSRPWKTAQIQKSGALLPEEIYFPPRPNLKRPRQNAFCCSQRRCDLSNFWWYLSMYWIASFTSRLVISAYSFATKCWGSLIEPKTTKISKPFYGT